MTIPATIYARFSNQEQSQGNSKDRQLTLCREMIARHKWQGAPDRELIDEGLSAFSGANRAAGGHLHSFEQAAEQGLYRNGHVLVVENLDRISRQGYDAILPFLQKLTSAGVTVATVDGERIYPANERVQMVSVIEAVLKSELSREESEKKSRRLKAAQNKRIENAQTNAGKFLSQTKTVPAWIETKRISPLNDRPLYQMSLNERRVEVLREIFQLTIDGFGTPAIAKLLNGRGEPVWNHLNRRSKNGWSVGYLTKIVLNRAVLGEYTPLNRPRGGASSSKGVTVLNHYPQAIDAVTFAKAAAARDSRKGSSGAWQISHGNLFSGIAKCASCRGRMKQEVTVRKGTLRRNAYGSSPAGQDFSYLKCHNALNKVWDEEANRLVCENRNWIRYEKLERGVLEVALKFIVTRQDVASDGRQDALRVDIAEKQRFLADKQRQVDVLVDSFSRTGSQSIERRMLQLEAELADDQTAIRQMEKGLADVPDASSIEDYEQRLAELLDVINSDDETERSTARIRVKQSLRGLITGMMCFDSKLTTVVFGRGLTVVFDKDGNELANRLNENVISLGPNGEIDWHPDFPDADYEIYV